ncbi:MAG TPA: STAS domain-containing protein [Vicinamibacterales bacterium]|nr:STAS domain-containing protein [Vicinamibacterales bacterium]
MRPVLQVDKRYVGQVTVFTISGQLAYEEGTRGLREAVNAAVADGARLCLLDMREVTYLDSSGVGLLVAIFRHVTRRGGQFKLLSPSPAARRVLGISQLTRVFDIFDDENDALLNLGGEAGPS